MKDEDIPLDAYYRHECRMPVRSRWTPRKHETYVCPVCETVWVRHDRVNAWSTNRLIEPKVVAAVLRMPNGDHRVVGDVRLSNLAPQRITRLDSPADPQRSLAVGDRLRGRPCVLTIETILGNHALGWCSLCEDAHVVDLSRYEAGKGPWQPEG